MKKLWLLLLMVIPLQLLHSQEVDQGIKHALTVEQCRADQKLWSFEEDRDSLSTHQYVSIKEVGKRHVEMVACGEVDPDHMAEYDNIRAGLLAEQAVRLTDFLQRHHLWDQFLAEDGQGKR